MKHKRRQERSFPSTMREKYYCFLSFILENFKVIGTPLYFRAIFTKGSNFRDNMFAFQGDKALSKIWSSSKGNSLLLEKQILSYLWEEFVLFLAVLENSVLPMGWDSSHAALKWRQNSKFQKLGHLIWATTKNTELCSKKVVMRRKMSKTKKLRVINNDFNWQRLEK